MRPVYLLITAHTTRHLRRTLLGVASQTRRPDLVVLSCDNDSAELAAAAEALAREFGLRMLLVQRPFTGAAHCGQVRNNAVRAVMRMQPPPDPDSLLICLDQDCIPSPGFVASHARLAERGDPVLAYRVDLTPQQTEAIDEEAIRSRRPAATPTGEQQAALERRHARLSRQALLRRLAGRFAKGHKPKILGANFAVTLRAYLDINGFDEEYRGYGQEDDDFVRRLYASGRRPAIGVREAIVYHQYHDTRAPDEWHAGPNAERFARGGPARCVHGVDAPLGQEEIRVRWIGPGSGGEGAPAEQAKHDALQPAAGGDG